MSPHRNLLEEIPLSLAHRGDLLSRTQRKKINRLVRLAREHGGIRCQGGYVVACCYCAWWFPLSRLTIEHVINRRDGGTNHGTNLALACYRCNNARCKRELQATRPYGIDKWQRRRLRHFRMDAGAPTHVDVIVRGHRLKLKQIMRAPAPASDVAERGR